MLSTENTGSANDPDTKTLSQVRIMLKDELLQVEPREGLAFEPFRLPPFPLSKSDWAASFCERAWQKHHRCIGILLLLNIRTRHWGFGIPRQRCMEDGACWSTARADFPDVDDSVRLGGSFQTRALAAADEPDDAVPPVDGLHFVMMVRADHWVIHPFLRVDGKLRSISPAEALWDDWSTSVDECRTRFELL